MLHILSLVLPTLALLFSGTTWSWSSPGVIITFILSGLILILYALQQRFSVLTTPQDRIFPVTIISTRTGILILLATACSAAAYAVTLYYLPLYYAFTRNDGPISAGVHMLPYLCVFIAFTLLGGILLPRLRLYAAHYLIGGILIAAGSGALVSVDYNTSMTAVMGLSAILGAGTGLTFQLGTASLGALLPPESRVDMIVALNQAQYGSVALSVAIAGCVFQNRGYESLRSVFEPLNFEPGMIRDALAGLKSPLLSGEDAVLREWAVAIIAERVVELFFLGIGAGVVMALCACRMKWEELSFGHEGEEEQGKNL
jgi:hypothetical protein